MGKFTEPKHIRLYHLQGEIIGVILNDKQFCIQNGIGSIADIIRKSLTIYLKQYELNKIHRQIGE